MTRVLRAIGAVLLIGGLLGIGAATSAMLGDEAYYRTAAALERHADNVIFQAEYQFAAARHGFLFAGILCGIAAIVGAANLFALAAILRRMHRLEERASH